MSLRIENRDRKRKANSISKEEAEINFDIKQKSLTRKIEDMLEIGPVVHEPFIIVSKSGAQIS